MAFFLFYPESAQSLIMWLALLGAMGLTYWECREQRHSAKVILWWLSFVFLINVPAYLILRGYVFYKSRREEEPA